MGKRTASDDIWAYLEPLSDAEIDKIYKAALSDWKYRASLYGAFLVYAVVLTGFCFVWPAFYRASHPGLLLKLGLAALVFLYIWYGVRLIGWLNQGFYDQAVMRRVRARQSANGA